MIDMILASQAFSEYVKPYDVTNGKIALKIQHTYRTVNVAKKIAEDLCLNEEQTLLAELIALLHDLCKANFYILENLLKKINMMELYIRQ